MPFALFLLSIATLPLIAPKWWSAHYGKFSFSCGSITALYYWISTNGGSTVARTAIDYVGFIVLIGTLFVVSGGIFLDIRGKAKPIQNCLFLLLGALLSNILGTTGAAVLLIRPWIALNRERFKGYHLAFFIFVVANVGGCLTPIGDPPLFLGYLAGVPFLWMARQAWCIWIVGVGILIGFFAIVENWNYKNSVENAIKQENIVWRFRILGWPNVLLLALVVITVSFVTRPMFFREGLLLGLAVVSHRLTDSEVYKCNQFNLHPIKEVAILFFGIFCTMMPALDWLSQNAGKYISPIPGTFYAGSGILSSVLDNAPTYLTFLNAAIGSFVDEGVVRAVRAAIEHHGVDVGPNLAGTRRLAAQATFNWSCRFHPEWLKSGRVAPGQIELAYLLAATPNPLVLAVSIGSVFFGANTYIGNGPNLIVKSIVDNAGIRTPSFFGYIFRFTIPVMLPMLIVVWFVFFK